MIVNAMIAVYVHITADPLNPSKNDTSLLIVGGLHFAAQNEHDEFYTSVKPAHSPLEGISVSQGSICIFIGTISTFRLSFVSI